MVHASRSEKIPTKKSVVSVLSVVKNAPAHQTSHSRPYGRSPCVTAHIPDKKTLQDHSGSVCLKKQLSELLHTFF